MEPAGTMGTIVDMMLIPGSRRQMVLVDPRLPEGEKERRVEVAASAVGREAPVIVFTSGTTGPAKGVRLSGANWAAAAAASARHLAHTADDVWLAAMPLHHVGGLSILYRSAFVGSTVRWLPRFDAIQVAGELRSGVTMVSLVPTMLRHLLDADSAPYTGLRMALVGGGPIPDGLLEEAQDRGIPALPTYGMTETCAQVATLRPGSGPRRAAHPLPGIEVSTDGQGLIRVRGRQVSRGYVDEDDRPREQWLVTPDRGRLEPDGALVVEGRADDVIVTGGENVDPAEVESVLVTHPAVRAVVVAGVPDAEWGSRVVAVFEGDVSAEALSAWARERLAPHQMPRSLQSVAAVPLNGLGKPDRPLVARLMF